MTRWGIICLFLCVLGTAVAAAAPETSLRPVTRTSETVPTLQELRPVARPTVLETALASQLARQFRRENDPAYQADAAEIMTARARAFAALSKQATGASLRPAVRPDGIVQKAMARKQERVRGAICQDADIQGETVGYVPGRISGCGI